MAESGDRQMGRVKFFSTKKEQDKGGYGFIDLEDGDDVHYNGVDYQEGFTPRKDDIVELTIAPNGPNNTTAKDIHVLWTYGNLVTVPVNNMSARGTNLSQTASGEEVEFFLYGERHDLVISVTYKVNGRPENSAEFPVYAGNSTNPFLAQVIDPETDKQDSVLTDDRGVGISHLELRDVDYPAGVCSHITVVTPRGQKISKPIPVARKATARGEAGLFKVTPLHKVADGVIEVHDSNFHFVVTGPKDEEFTLTSDVPVKLLDTDENKEIADKVTNHRCKLDPTGRFALTVFVRRLRADIGLAAPGMEPIFYALRCR